MRGGKGSRWHHGAERQGNGVTGEGALVRSGEHGVLQLDVRGELRDLGRQIVFFRVRVG